ncbi:MAG: lytic transglycosylase domain-containing protein [Firmicutes bacterium]|nr:lytic transglycosylase domain-containing protein [Bacillota bacterium]
MFITTKKILITTFVLTVTLFGCSTILASQILAPPMVNNPVITFHPETIQMKIIDQMITKFNPRLSLEDKDLIITTIIQESQATKIDPLLIASVIAAESSFRPKAVSPCEARGLMQITSCVSRIMKISNPFDIQQNIHAGTRYLQDLYRRFEQFELILAAYNAGPTRVARLGRVPRITETINYIERVSQFYQSNCSKLLSTINDLIGKPVFNPIRVSVASSQSPKVIIELSADEPIDQPIIIEEIWCETARPDRFLFIV